MVEFTEWRNKNHYRSYPVADDASWTATNGSVVPQEVFLDAMLTPIDPEGTVYVSAIDLSNNRVEVSDDNGLLAWAIVTAEDTLTFADEYGRKLGVIVVSEEFRDLGGTLTFESHALPLAPAAVIPQVQNCVRGIQLPDGTVVTGDVEIIGVNGIVVEHDVAANALTFSAIGEPNGPECVTLPPPVQCVEVLQTGTGGTFAVSFVDDVLYLDTSLTLEEICAAKKSVVLPDEDGQVLNRRGDPCEEEPEVPCEPPAPVDPISSCTMRSLRIVPVSSLIGMLGIEEPGIPAYAGAEGLDALPERSKQGFKIYMRGL